MDREAWHAAIHGVAKSPTRLSDWTELSWTEWPPLASHVVLLVKNLSANAGDIRDTGLNPRLRRSLGGGHGNTVQYSCLENPMDRGSWQATILKVTKNRTQLKRFTMHAYNNLSFIVYSYHFDNSSWDSSPAVFPLAVTYMLVDDSRVSLSLFHFCLRINLGWCHLLSLFYRL